MLTDPEEAEIAALAKALGTPVRWEREYGADTERNQSWLQRMLRRRGEIIAVVPRPGGRVLVHTKSTYPDGLYRLPGGGIDPDEPVQDAARRETREEMGFDVPMARFLGVIENRFLARGERFSYPSYIFMTEPTAEAPQVLDPHEQISGFMEVAVGELARIAAQLEALPPEWQPWGRFRAAPHALTLDALNNDSRR